MKCIKTEDAVGHVLCHDMTQIIPGVSKGPRFCKGHIVTAEDIPVLLSMGKERDFASGSCSRVFCTRMTRQSGCVRSVRIPICVKARQKRAKSSFTFGH